eukprot:403370734
MQLSQKVSNVDSYLQQQHQLQNLRFKSEEEAKKAAREHLKSIVKSRLNYQSLQFLREENELKKEEVDKELLFNIEKKIQDLSKSIQQLTEKEQVTKEIRFKIEAIRDIWQSSCGKFTDISEDVDELLITKRHVERVASMLQNFLNIGEKVEELQRQLGDEDALFSVYKKIKIMNFMRMSFLKRIEEQAGGSKSQRDRKEGDDMDEDNGLDLNKNQQEKLRKIKEHFRAVGDLEKQFQKIIFDQFTDAHELAKKDPSLLVKILRIIENEEITNQSLKEKLVQQQEEEMKHQIDLPRDTSITPAMIQRQKTKRDQKNEKQQQIFDKMDEQNKQDSLKERCMNLLRQSIKSKANEFYLELTGETNQKQFMLTLKQSEALMQDLKYVIKTVVPCFPPHYEIFKFYFDAYKRVFMDRIDSYMSQMDALLSQDPEIILVFNSFVQTCQSILNELGHQDEVFVNLQFRLEEFYPKFMEHAEEKFYERMQRILDEQKNQENEIIELIQMKKKKGIKYETTFNQDIYEFMDTQLDVIQESLKGEKLLEFMKRMLDVLVSLVAHIVEKSLNFEPKKKSEMVTLLIRMNDLTKVINDYEKFKERSIKLCGDQLLERVENVFDDYFRELIASANQITEVIALYVIKSEIEQDLLIQFFTIEWKDNANQLLEEVLQCAHSYLIDIQKMAIEERFASKVAESLFCLLIDSYIERFIIAVNQRFKLRLPIDKALLDYIYSNSKLKKKNKDKLIHTKMLLDFKQKDMDQILFEQFQADIKQFEIFRETYKEEIMQNRFVKKIQLLSIISLIINSQDEREFMDYEEQFWTMNGTEVSLANSYIEGAHLVRCCRKLKTRKQKGFFKQTKALERKEMRKLKKLAKKQKKESKKQKKVEEKDKNKNKPDLNLSVQQLQRQETF